MRASGILMPVFSLPGPYGIGTLGNEAFAFVDFLAAAKQTYWQILPIGPTGYGDSPYQSFSAFAGNPYFIDFRLLAADGLLTEAELPAPQPVGPVDYGALYQQRPVVLHKAADRLPGSPSPAAVPRRHCGQVQRGGAAVGGNSARHAYISSQCFLKFANFGTAGGNPAGSNSLGSVSCFFFAEVRHGKRDKTRHLQDPPIKFIGGCARQKNGQRAHKVKTKYILLHYTLFYLLRQEKLAAARGRCYNKPYFAQSTRSVGKEEGI